jgi:hypothetical protein
VKKLMEVVLIGASWMLAGLTASAQNTPPQESITHVIKDQDLNLLRQDLRSKRKQLDVTSTGINPSFRGAFWAIVMCADYWSATELNFPLYFAHGQ